MLQNHRDLLLNWFKSEGLSGGIVEGLNNEVKTVTKGSYGFRTEELKNSALPQSWTLSGASFYPQILVRRPKNVTNGKT